MKKCNHCDVYINTERFTCPLCRNALEVVDEKPMDVEYQPFPPFSERVLKRKNFIHRLFVFLTFVAIVTSIIVNITTYRDGNPNLWSLVVIISIFLVWSFIKGIIISKENFAKRLGLFSLLLCVLFYTIELLTPTKGWTINYLIPFIFMGTIVTLLFSAFLHPKLYQNYVVYFLLYSFFAIIPYILLQFSVVKVEWPSIASGILGITTVLGMFILVGKKTREEIKKRIHI